MSYTNKVLMLAMLLTARLYAQDQQDQVALNIIKAMQECIASNQQAQGQLKGQSVEQQASLWSKAMEYIKNLRVKHGTSASRPALTQLPISANNGSLSIQQNQYKFLFERLLDEYLVHLGQLYEKQAGLLGAYRTSYYISSKNDQSLSITPNEYEQFVQTLNAASRQLDWGKSINLSLVFSQANRAPIQKTLTLNEIIGAVKNVPLPVSYYTRAAQIGAGVVAAGAIGAGAYYAYNAYTNGQPVALPALEKEVVNATDSAEQLDQTPEVVQPATSTTPQPKKFGQAGLERYMNDVASNPDFDNSFSSDSYVTPDDFDKAAAPIIATTAIGLPAYNAVAPRATALAAKYMSPNAAGWVAGMPAGMAASHVAVEGAVKGAEVLESQASNLMKKGSLGLGTPKPIANPNAQVIIPGSVTPNPNATVVLPNTVAANPGAQVIIPGSATPNPNATIVLPKTVTANPGARVIIPGAVPANPNAGLLLPNN